MGGRVIPKKNQVIVKHQPLIGKMRGQVLNQLKLKESKA
jgi:hypothetical protein